MDQGLNKTTGKDHKDVSKMNIISAYILGWITFSEALEKMKSLNEETDEQELKKVL